MARNIYDKYRRTFYLIGGEVLITYTESKEIAHLSLSDQETLLLARNGEKEYMIPFFSVGYIETEELDEYDE